MGRITLSEQGYLRLGVLISGRGSNLEALIRACAQEDFPAKISVVISNNPDAPGLQHAEKSGLPALVIDHRKYATKKEFEEEIDSVLQTHDVDLVCLAGFMRLLSPWFIARNPLRIINIHPSLLPAFKGLNPQAQALAANVKTTGCTVHFVTEEMDAGPIILQGEVPVLARDTADTLSARILEAEHRIYPQAVQRLATHDFHIHEGRVADWVEKIADTKSARYP